ncbi:MAG: DUF4974 domain-containing protein [Bacteroides sp.]|nr:DUF4974 domain-containing protein [Bacteroides sp.]
MWLEDIIKRLERRFQVKITVRDPEDPNDYYSVKFVNGENLEQIMKVLKGIEGNFIYEIQE